MNLLVLLVAKPVVILSGAASLLFTKSANVELKAVEAEIEARAGAVAGEAALEAVEEAEPELIPVPAPKRAEPDKAAVQPEE